MTSAGNGTVGQVAHRTRLIGGFAETVGALALEAMLYEVTCTPSPGLVDRINSGAHTDMDFFSFMSSSAALGITMTRCVQAGINHSGELPALLPILRKIGMDGEARMLKATGGVNTQKGLLFSLGIVAAVIGWKHRRRRPLFGEEILSGVAVMSRGLVARELGDLAKPESKLTAGEKLYRRFGIAGIRGEMEQGLPTVLQFGLPTLRQALKFGLGINRALLQTLLVLMTKVDDTTVMNRHHPDKMRVWVKRKAQDFLDDGGMFSEQALQRLEQLDREFIEHNVSPGGVADLLSVSWFLHRVEEQLGPR